MITKKVIFIFATIFTCLNAINPPTGLHFVDSTDRNITVAWDPVENRKWYNVLVDNNITAMITDTTITITKKSINGEDLDPATEYNISISVIDNN